MGSQGRRGVAGRRGVQGSSWPALQTSGPRCGWAQPRPRPSGSSQSSQGRQQVQDVPPRWSFLPVVPGATPALWNPLQGSLTPEDSSHYPRPLSRYANVGLKIKETWAFRVIQWLRICLVMQGTQVRALVGALQSHMLQLSPSAGATAPACSGACATCCSY